MTDFTQIPENERIYCQCGQAYQTKEGWEAQGLFEDLPNGHVMLHNLTPEKCIEVEN